MISAVDNIGPSGCRTIIDILTSSFLSTESLHSQLIQLYTVSSHRIDYPDWITLVVGSRADDIIELVHHIRYGWAETQASQLDSCECSTSVLGRESVIPVFQGELWIIIIMARAKLTLLQPMITRDCASDRGWCGFEVTCASLVYCRVSFSSSLPRTLYIFATSAIQYEPTQPSPSQGMTPWPCTQTS